MTEAIVVAVVHLVHNCSSIISAQSWHTCAVARTSILFGDFEESLVGGWGVFLDWQQCEATMRVKRHQILFLVTIDGEVVHDADWVLLIGDDLTIDSNDSLGHDAAHLIVGLSIAQIVAQQVRDADAGVLTVRSW